MLQFLHMWRRAISGGFAPMIATGLLAYFGTIHAISWYLVALGAITLIATLVSRETAFEDLQRIMSRPH
jgi:hypothetical protein